MAIDKGEKVVLKGTFTDDSGANTDPTTPVEATILRPDGTKEGPFTATKQSTGVYEHTYTTDGAGEYKYKFESADGAIEQDNFYARDDETDT